jgi:hypothetical protein
MPRFQSIEELLLELYRNRGLLSGMFGKRYLSVAEEEILPLMDDDPEKLERLVGYGILEKEHNTYSLDSQLREFFEEFLEINEEVHVLYIQEYLDKIDNLRNYYLKETNQRRKNQHSQKIKHYLRRINRVTLGNVKTLRKKTDDTYKAETNYEVKRDTLKDLRDQRDKLEGVLQAVEKRLSDELFFRNAADEEFLYIIHFTKINIQSARHNLLEIQQQIIDYLNQVEHRSAVIEKVLRLKGIKDKMQLKELTDFEHQVKELPGLPAIKREQFRTRLPLRLLSEDEQVYQLIRKVASKKHSRQLEKANMAGELKNRDLEDQYKTAQTYNLDKLFKIFQSKDQDLFRFLLWHPFNREVNQRERLKLYCRMASKFADRLHFTHQTERHNHWEYALIYPNNKTEAHARDTQKR